MTPRSPRFPVIIHGMEKGKEKGKEGKTGKEERMGGAKEERIGKFAYIKGMKIYLGRKFTNIM